MGFLQWFSNNSEVEQTSGSQLDLFGNSENLPERRQINGAIVNQNFNGALSEHGVDAKGRAMAINAVTQEVMGCSTKELYEQTGATKNKRATLPEVAQTGLMMGEAAATFELQQTPPVAGTQEEKNAHASQTSRRGASKIKGALPWN